MKVEYAKCQACGRGAPQVRFGTLADTGQLDTLCIRCRFDRIDNKHSSIKGIRKDMEAVGIPVSRGVPAKRLKTRRAGSPAETGSPDIPTRNIPEDEE